MTTHAYKQQTSQTVQPTERILRWPEVHMLVGLSRAYIHRLASQGRFPAPIKLGIHSSGWLESEVQSWLAQRIIESRQK